MMTRGTYTYNYLIVASSVKPHFFCMSKRGGEVFVHQVSAKSQPQRVMMSMQKPDKNTGEVDCALTQSSIALGNHVQSGAKQCYDNTSDDSETLQRIFSPKTEVHQEIDGRVIRYACAELANMLDNISNFQLYIPVGRKFSSDCMWATFLVEWKMMTKTRDSQ